jgi:hypothetical protein
MNEHLKKALAYWLYFIFDIERKETIDMDAGTNRREPVLSYHRAKDEFMINYVYENQLTALSTAYERSKVAEDILKNRQQHLAYIMKGMGKTWRTEISNFKPLD